jgi:LAS superfamily LD-carboxypeptidase LdcB
MLRYTQQQSLTRAIPQLSFAPIQASFLQRKCACGQHTIAGAECEECCQKREATLQRTAVSSALVNALPPVVHEALSSPGQPLDGATREFMEPRFGYDFSSVLVNTNAPKIIQTKLAVNEPGDEDEQEADRIAETVMRMPDSGSTGKHTVQAKEVPDDTPEVPHDVDTYISTIQGRGQSLSESVRNFFEPRFGYDFSQVRIHTDHQASESAQKVNALAYTIGSDIVFDAGQYIPESSAGKRLLAHELAHVVQQSTLDAGTQVQRTFRLSELLPSTGLTARPANPIETNPDTFFYPGSARNTSNRRALVIAGIHGQEASATALGGAVNAQLSSGSLHTDFHLIVIPQVNPHPFPAGPHGRAAGSGGTLVEDLNREFVAGRPSRNPYAQRITTIISEFDPERILSIHAISDPSDAGVFLDPIHTGAYPHVDAERQRREVFSRDPRNLEAMHLTEAMIGAVSPPSSGHGPPIPGNIPRSDFPRSQYPTPPGGTSPYSLIYPLQGSVHGSLGELASGLGKTIVTIEIPGYAPTAPWRSFVPAVQRFLEISSASPSTSPSGTTPQPQPPASGPIRKLRRKVSGFQIQRQRQQQITSASLSRNRDADLDRFMRHVYDLQVQLWTRQGISYVAGVPATDLVTLSARDALPGRSIQLHRLVAGTVQSMLAAARTDLAAARASGDASARGVTDIRVRSGYRSAAEQLSIWERFYPQYYRETESHRRALPHGEHGEEATQYLAEYINQRVFSPGYSPHQRGQTVDFTYNQNGVWAEADSTPAGISSWERSWLFDWLQRHAISYGFVQNPNIHEPWHWEYNQTLALILDFFRWLESVLLKALRSLHDLFLGGEEMAPQGERVSPPREPVER